MPGRKLSNDERRLLEFWNNPPQNFPKPILRQVSIEGVVGLRGIQRLIVPFGFPITAICGRNGVGKSTVLALCAVSCRAPAEWIAYWSNTRPKVRPRPGIGYTFADFFHRRRADPLHDALRVGWVFFEQGNEVDHVQQALNGRWRRVADAGRHGGRATLPTREIDFIPISRALPPADLSLLRSAFRGARQSRTEALDAESLGKLSFILGKRYEAADTLIIRGLGLPTCRAEANYSGFDMGAGECALITLLSRLQGMPVGGLVVIEELELGLHGEAQQRLIQILVEICLAKKLQIVCTTHSEVILDSLPRQARILLRKHGGEHETATKVSTRFAVHEMAGAPRPELMIYTEDKLAAVLVEESLPNALRCRVVICDVGDGAALARQAISHLRMNADLRALSTFDGDCATADIERWIQSERAGRQELQPDWLILPGNGLSPERWLLAALQAPAYRTELARELSCSDAEASGHIDAMRVQLDPHGCGFVLSQRTGLGGDDCRRRIARSVARLHPELEALRARVAQALG